MALGNNNNNEFKSKSLKLLAEAGPTTVKPTLALKKKNEATGKYELSWEVFSNISWVIKGIKTSHNWKTWMKEVKWFVLTLEDWDERYYIDATMTNASKDLANMWLVNIWNNVNISLYLNKNWYPSVSVKLDDWSFAKWKFQYPLDKDLLWNAIKEQEYVPQEGSNNEINIEDIRF